MSDHNEAPIESPRKVSTGPHRGYCFTAFVPHTETWDLPDIVPAGLQYCVWQYEKCPETGRLHIQGYAEFLKPQRVAGARRILGLPQSTHFEARLGTKEDARKYCMKEETRVLGPFERGVWNPARTGGERNRLDIAAFKEYALSPEVVADRTKTERWFRLNFIEIYDRHPRAFAVAMDELARLRVPTELDIELRDWEQKLLHDLQQEPIRRRIFWVWSEAGGTGKTTFVDYLVRVAMRDRILVGSWSLRDTVHAYRPGEHHVLAFNIPRDSHGDKVEGYLAVLERLSDHCQIMSGKYDSGGKYVMSHILVTSNMPPPYESLPLRLVECRLDKGHPVWPTHPLAFSMDIALGAPKRIPAVQLLLPPPEEAPPPPEELDPDWDPTNWPAPYEGFN